MSEFQIRKNEHGDILGCDSCQAEVETVEHENGMPRVKAQLCKYCFGSFIGNAHFYPNQYENVSLFQSMGACFNILEKALKP